MPHYPPVTVVSSVWIKQLYVPDGKRINLWWRWADPIGQHCCHTSVSWSLHCSTSSSSSSFTRSFFFFRLRQKPFRPQKQAQVNGMAYLSRRIRVDLQEGWRAESMSVVLCWKLALMRRAFLVWTNDSARIKSFLWCVTICLKNAKVCPLLTSYY